MVVVGIYKITNISNNKIYIGKSVNIWKRWSAHKLKLSKNLHSNTHLQASYNKYGLENFICEILEVCSEESLNDREMFWISKLNSRDKNIGYNKVQGGTGGKLNPESLAKMAASHRGKKMPEHVKDKISKANAGRKRSEEEKLKISKAHKGKLKSESQILNIYKTLKGRKPTAEQRQKMSLARKGIKQRVLSCPHCPKSGGTTMYRWHFDNCKHNMNKIKQVIIIRKDLGMRLGKQSVQAAHASLMAILANSQIIQNPEVSEWLSGIYTKICVGIEGEEALLDIYRKAKNANLLCSLVQDVGLTEFGGVPTYTAVAVGPGKPEDIDPITGHLKLL
ncbi:MAG TPA: aminoacyl-tRNA hydrolase [Leptospiraceae bacterium]|nr:aminoacyl-tRNA hydrolase [Leptospiraceae bacterium]